MADFSEMVRAVLDSPDDVGVRLGFADLLEENGEWERSEFIRIQCRLARINRDWEEAGLSQTPDGFTHVAELRRRGAELLATEGPPVWGTRSKLRGGVWTTHAYRWMGSTLRVGWCEWHRGFIEEISCGVEDWQEFGPRICGEHPVRTIEFTNLVCSRSGYPEEAVFFALVPNHWTRSYQHWLPQEWWGGVINQSVRYANEKEARRDASERAIAWARERAGLAGGYHGVSLR